MQGKRPETRLMQARAALAKAHARRAVVEQAEEGMSPELRAAYEDERRARAALEEVRAQTAARLSEQLAASDPEYRRLVHRAEAFRVALGKVAACRAMMRKTAKEVRSGAVVDLGEPGNAIFATLRQAIRRASTEQLDVLAEQVHRLEDLANRAGYEAQAYLEAKVEETGKEGAA